VTNVLEGRGTLIKVVAFTVVAVLTTTLVATTLLDLHVGATDSYRARFTNASGLQAGDTVRIAGVETGKVNAVDLVGRDQAMVSFSVDANQPLTTTTRAEIHFENLLGQRFLALVPGKTAGAPLRHGSTIPLSRTEPALDLTSVFDGFQPLFSALSPNQVNQLTESIIQVFQGQSGTFTNLVDQTASLTSNLAGRQVVIDQVVNNLSQLLTSVGAHDQQLGQLIDSFSGLVSGLAAQRPQIASAIDGVSTLTAGVSNILSQPALNESITGLAGVSASIAGDQTSLDQAITGLPGLLTTFNKVTSSGSYLSVYICNLTIQSTGSLDISLIPGLATPQAGDPVTIPSGPVGDQSQHTANCS
jgi:phospholipid/cholesterol/gamma-HCH transport system substrate-binding protein